jgi:hypothetical protein
MCHSVDTVDPGSLYRIRVRESKEPERTLKVVDIAYDCGNASHDGSSAPHDVRKDGLPSETRARRARRIRHVGLQPTARLKLADPQTSPSEKGAKERAVCSVGT